MCHHFKIKSGTKDPRGLVFYVTIYFFKAFVKVNNSERVFQAIGNIPYNLLGLRRILRGLTTFSVFFLLD